ncbi:hypothetical protein PRUPE_4G258600 [Prunus persica]|uniref:Uncharacterized protein n=1 Tax=Prunus persica TaxID=3760 RepID=A0A251PR48_PRUPE|nr:hypothetical protein PRUPE_4G258600 [Prunus persica]
MPQSWSATSVFIHGWCIRLWHRQGGCRKLVLYPLSLEASSLPISQLGNLDFYLDFSVNSSAPSLES